MITNSLVHQITLGRSGKNWGLSMGMPKLESIIDGVTKGTYTLLFSGTGSGKTSLALYSYIYRPLVEHLHDDNFKVTYYSLEMSSELLFAKLLCMHIFEEYGVELSTKELLSKEKGYTFSFDNGNHFIMIAQSLDDKALYVVMHSSVKEFKDSYMGLYPVEENWFSDSIRTYHDNGRYLRYI